MAQSSQPDIGVVHLVRAHNGLKVFREFIDSYRLHPAGFEHELVLMLKGFTTPRASEPYRQLVADLSGLRFISVEDAGLDIGSYLTVSRRLPHRRLLFTNSYSRIQAEGWLASMAEAHEQPGVGIAGSTGSWASVGSMLSYQLRESGPYAEVYAGDPAFDVASGLAGIEAHRFGGLRVARIRASARVIARFGPFPWYSIRTNSFLIWRELMLKISARPPRDKLHALQLECGRRSITRQIEQMGLRPVVVGRDGRSYERLDWPSSHTLWQGDQENLLIADNRTDDYERADDPERLAMSRYAWGVEADPAMTRSLAA
jgi:hypothetical protein